MHLSTTTDALTGLTGTYFDVKQGPVTISVASARYDLGSGSNGTAGHIGLFGIDSTAADQWDYYWHPGGGTPTISHAGRRPHGSDSGGVTSKNPPITSAYPKGTQSASLSISYDSTGDQYLYQLTVGGTLAATHTVAGSAFDGRIDTVGFRHGGNTTQNPSSFGEFGALTISGALIPEPSAALLGGLGALLLLRRRRN